MIVQSGVSGRREELEDVLAGHKENKGRRTEMHSPVCVRQLQREDGAMPTRRG